MGKKSAAAADTGDERTLRVKFTLTPAEHRRLKVASAVLEQTITDLCREAVLARVDELIREMNLPEPER